jgi:hypothetical protein
METRFSEITISGQVNEATFQYVGVVLDPLKPRISCQYPHFAQTEDIGLKSALEEKRNVLLITGRKQSWGRSSQLSQLLSISGVISPYYHRCSQSPHSHSPCYLSHRGNQSSERRPFLSLLF